MKSRSQALRISLTLCLLLSPLAGWGQPSEWKWMSGANLKAVKFVGQKGWIIGDDGNQGIILHTTNGGDTWATQPHNTGRHYFRGLSFCDSLNGWIVGGFRSSGESGFILQTQDGGQSWVLRNSPTTYNLNRVCFIDVSHGWMVSDTSAIFRTTDGGNNWEGDSVDRGYNGIDFVDSLKGFAVSGGGIFHIAKTTDGGRNWLLQMDNNVVPTSSIEMADSMKGWSAGLPNWVVITTDGWQSWSQVPCGGGGDLRDISFYDTLNGFMVGGENNHFAQYYKTTNGGLTWYVDSITRNNAFNGVDAKQLPTVWIAGEAGSILKTTTSGSTWTVTRNTDIKAYSLFNGTFYDTNQGWATGENGVITHTTNGGTVWNRQVSGTFNWIYGVDFPTPQRGWVCSDGAEILTTSDAGNTWNFQASNTTYPLFSIDFPDTNTLVGVAVGGYYGPLDNDISDFGFRISNLTASDKIASSRYGSPRNDTPWIQDTIQPWGTGSDFWKWPWRPEETLLQTPYRTITRTTNGGALWTAVNSTGQVPLYGVSFATSAEGWACGDPQGGMGVILHTTDSGATWTGQTSNVNQTLNWIQFRGTQTGWCVGSGGTALWTTDGGTTWNSGNSGTTAVLWSCGFYDALHGFACGNNGLLIKTTDGGRNWTPDTSKVYSNLMAVNALDSSHAWSVGSYGMVLGWREAGISGTEIAAEGRTRIAEGRLEQSYPNPMRENCAIGYWLPTEAKPELSIYDITGRRVRFFAPLRMTAPGRHRVVWDGRDEIGKKVPSGVYFYQLRTKDLSATKKLIKVQ